MSGEPGTTEPDVGRRAEVKRHIGGRDTAGPARAPSAFTRPGGGPARVGAAGGILTMSPPDLFQPTFANWVSIRIPVSTFGFDLVNEGICEHPHPRPQPHPHPHSSGLKWALERPRPSRNTPRRKYLGRHKEAAVLGTGGLDPHPPNHHPRPARPALPSHVTLAPQGFPLILLLLLLLPLHCCAPAWKDKVNRS